MTSLLACMRLYKDKVVDAWNVSCQICTVPGWSLELSPVLLLLAVAQFSCRIMLPHPIINQDLAARFVQAPLSWPASWWEVR